MVSQLSFFRWKKCNCYSSVTYWSHGHGFCGRNVDIHPILVLVSTFPPLIVGFHADLLNWTQCRYEGKVSVSWSNVVDVLDVFLLSKFLAEVNSQKKNKFFQAPVISMIRYFIQISVKSIVRHGGCYSELTCYSRLWSFIKYLQILSRYFLESIALNV